MIGKREFTYIFRDSQGRAISNTPSAPKSKMMTNKTPAKKNSAKLSSKMISAPAAKAKKAIAKKTATKKRK